MSPGLWLHKRQANAMFPFLHIFISLFIIILFQSTTCLTGPICLIFYHHWTLNPSRTREFCLIFMSSNFKSFSSINHVFTKYNRIKMNNKVCWYNDTQYWSNRFFSISIWKLDSQCPNLLCTILITHLFNDSWWNEKK